MALPSSCWCAVRENHSPPLSSTFFFYWVLDLFTVAIVPTCSKAAAPLCFLSLTIADYNTRKAVARQFAWYLWKQFLLSVSVAPTWASHRQKLCCENMMVRAVLQGQAGAILCNTRAPTEPCVGQQPPPGLSLHMGSCRMTSLSKASRYSCHL